MSLQLTSEIDDDAYCVCVLTIFHSVRIKIRPVRTMYAVKISDMQTVFCFMRTQIKNMYLLKLSQINNFLTSFVWLLCQQSKSSYNINVALINPYYISCNILCISSSYTIYVFSVQCLGQPNCLPNCCQITKGLFMKFNGSVSLWFIESAFGLQNRHFASVSGHSFHLM